jgi:hypothetical protein
MLYVMTSDRLGFEFAICQVVGLAFLALGLITFLEAYLSLVAAIRLERGSPGGRLWQWLTRLGTPARLDIMGGCFLLASFLLCSGLGYQALAHLTHVA